MNHRHLLLLFLGISLTIVAVAQTADSVNQAISPKYITEVSSHAGQLDQKLDRKTKKLLRQWRKQEARIQAKLQRRDSAKAAAVFNNAEAEYSKLDQRLQHLSSRKPYLASLDTLGTSLKFLEQNPALVSKLKDGNKNIQEALSKVNGLQDRFQQAEEIKKFLKQRKQYLKGQLEQLGFAKEFKKLNKQVYYYSEQLREYKELLKDHRKAERKALELLSKTKLFKDFMQKNSQLASLFRMPGSLPQTPSGSGSLAGLQTRTQVNALIQQQIAAGGPNAQAQFRENLQQAQSELHKLKTKLGKLGRGSSDAEMPEGFRPNGQKTKSFLQRLELGANIQSNRPNGLLPVTSDIGLSVGYKLNDKSILGIGASYKLGWGQNIRHIKLSHQGVGLRSFVDWKIPSPFGGGRVGALWISGGYEMNYRSEFDHIDQLKDLSSWQQSGLIGLSKVISVKTKFFKKTKLQLLWDFLSYQQVPRGQPLVFRIGYTIN